MFLLANAGIVVGAAMLYWLSKYVSNKALRIFTATLLFAFVFVLADNFVKIILLMAGSGAESGSSLLVDLAARFAGAVVFGGVSLYLLVENEERLDNWIMIYVASIVIMLFL